MAKIDYDDSQSESLHIRAANSLRSEAALIKNELTREQIQKAMVCGTAEELMALAKAEGIELTEEEAKAYMDEMADFEVDSDVLQKAAGGICWQHCVGPYKDVPCKAYCPVSMVG